MLDKITDDEYNRFYDSLKFVIKWEGGYVNDAADSGGATKWGITQKTYDRWRTKQNLSPQDVSLLSPTEAAEIYYTEYWCTSGANSLMSPLCTVVFDSAILCGPNRAIGWFREAEGDPVRIIALRRTFHLKLASTRPKDRKFLNGWLNRCNDLAKYVEMKTAP